MIKCDELDYSTYRYYIIILFLLFWTLFPILILTKMIKEIKNKDNFNYCTIKLKYGYYFIEFRRKYFYWEFVRHYFKILIVYIIGLSDYVDRYPYNLSIIILIIYILIIYAIEPFQNKYFNKLEVFYNVILIIVTFLS